MVNDRKGKRGFKLVNTFDTKKSPSQIITGGSYNKYRPAVFSDCIFADMFLYSMSSPTYILNVPFLNSASLGLNSSSHQAHVKHHIHGFGRVQEIQSMFKKGIYPLPPFLSPLESSHPFNFNLSQANDRNIDKAKTKKVATSAAVHVGGFPAGSVDWTDLAKKTPLALKDMAAKIRNG